MTGGQYGFWAPLAQRVAGPSSLQQWAAQNLGGLFQTPQTVTQGLNYGNQAFNLAGQVANGQTLANDPSLQAAKTTFNQSILPDVLQQQVRSMGTSRSTGAENAVANAWGRMALPLTQDALAREQQAIGRQAQTGLELSRLFPQIGMSEAQRQQSVLGTGMQFGGIGRDIAQQANNAQYQDLLRRQALWEDLWKVPMGQASSTFGRRTSTSGGLFK